jgi:hypothetical protein
MNRVDGAAKKKKEIIQKYILDEDFWNAASRTENILKPISKIIALLESNRSFLSDVYRCFLDLFKEWKNDKEIQNLVLKRWEFLHTESMGIAFFLDPKSKGGVDMIDDDRIDTIDQLECFILSKKNISDDKEAVSNEIVAFIEFIENPSEKYRQIIEEKSVRYFWNVVGMQKFPVLKKVADVIFSIPTSQAASERIWSIFDFVHTKRRNRLLQSKVHKLVSLYANSAINKNEQSFVSILMDIEDDEDDEDDDLENNHQNSEIFTD